MMMMMMMMTKMKTEGDDDDDDDDESNDESDDDDDDDDDGRQQRLVRMRLCFIIFQENPQGIRRKMTQHKRGKPARTTSESFSLSTRELQNQLYPSAFLLYLCTFAYF